VSSSWFWPTRGPSDRSSSLGWKTDANDATWLAELMAHGLIRASFVPDEPTQQMRDLPRTRKQMVRERSSQGLRLVNRLRSLAYTVEITPRAA